METLFEVPKSPPGSPRVLWSGSAVVYGSPQAMGSKRGFYVKNLKRVVITDEKGKKLKTFQEGLREAMRECKPGSVLLGPVAISLELVMPRPKGHFGTGRNARVLKSNAPDLCTTKPDADKVLRAILDCGTQIWWRDDSQIADISLLKRYARPGEETHCRIDAREMEEAAHAA